MSRCFAIQSFTRKRVNCAKMKILTKLRIMQIILFVLAFLLVSRSKPFLNFFTRFFTITSSFTNTILLKTAHNHDRQRIFDKTAYVQSQDFTPTLKFYTSSTLDAHDIFHVWVRVQLDLAKLS